MSDVVPLGSITTWLSGGTPSRSNASFWSGDVPWISAATMKSFEVADSDQRVTPAAVRSGSKMAPLNSTLLLVRGSALHNEIRASLVVAPVCFNQDVKALIPHDRVEPRFLTHSLRANASLLLKTVSSATNSAGVLDTRQTQSLPVWVPSREAQREIVGRLDDADSLIAILERKLAKKQAIKQGMMQQLLTGRTRLPGFTAPWREVTIGDLAGVTGGGTPSTRISDLWGGGIPWFTPAEIPKSGAGVVTASGRTITEAGLQKSAAKLLPEGTVLVTSRASIANCAIAGCPVATNQGFTSLVPKNRGSTRFLYYWVQQHRSRFVARAAGSTFLEISGSKVAAIEILAPDADEQAAIGAVLSDSDAELRALNQRLTKARELKLGMMQELLTGRTRLAAEAAA